jgi:hypothetical protein
MPRPESVAQTLRPQSAHDVEPGLARNLRMTSNPGSPAICAYGVPVFARNRRMTGHARHTARETRYFVP